jgi:hypothetical protein
MLYYHTKAGEVNNRVTIGGNFCEDGTLCLVAARTSTKDNFEKKTGRELVDRRFKVKRHCISIPIEEQTTKSFVEIAKKLARLIADDIKFKENIANYRLV